MTITNFTTTHKANKNLTSDYAAFLVTNGYGDALFFIITDDDVIVDLEDFGSCRDEYIEDFCSRHDYKLEKVFESTDEFKIVVSPIL